MTLTDLERDAMIRTVYGEARNEPPEGQVAVAHVILNRAKDPGTDWWGDNVWDVCHKRMQFSCWNGGDPNLPKIANLPLYNIEYQYIGVLVDEVAAGRRPDPTHGATHYKRHDIKASWDSATVGKPSVRIGAHVFYALGPSA